jgi:4-aminobutyrate aminotransferase-like enzyme
MGDYAMHKLRALQKENSPIGDVRGLGLIGVELIKDQRKTPAPQEPKVFAIAVCNRDYC